MHTQLTLKKDDLIEGTIHHLAFGGEGILRHNNQVIFVPFTAPGDTIVCRVTETKKTFARGRIEKLLHPSSVRITPACPHFGICGGCQIQHLSYDCQLNYKQNAVKETFQRIAHLHLEAAPSITPASRIWDYRRHITLTVKKENGNYQAGYIAADHYSFLPIIKCPIFTDPTDPLISILQSTLSQLTQDGSNEGKVYILKNEDGTYIWHLRFEKLPCNSRVIFESAFSNHSVIAGILLSSRKGEIVIGKPTALLSVEGLNFDISPGTFLQNHPEQSLNIYKEICNRVTDAAEISILDLYSGIGISALLLARQGAKVTGVEYNSVAVAIAQHTAKRHQIPISFIQGDVTQVLKTRLYSSSPDVIIVNPPREGMDSKVLAWLKSSKAKQILYISCMPSTMARDLKALCENTYSLHSCQLFDMFPQTAHVETLAELRISK